MWKTEQSSFPPYQPSSLLVFPVSKDSPPTIHSLSQTRNQRIILDLPPPVPAPWICHQLLSNLTSRHSLTCPFLSTPWPLTYLSHFVSCLDFCLPLSPCLSSSCLSSNLISMVQGDLCTSSLILLEGKSLQWILHLMTESCLLHSVHSCTWSLNVCNFHRTCDRQWLNYSASINPSDNLRKKVSS